MEDDKMMIKVSVSADDALYHFLYLAEGEIIVVIGVDCFE